jgi:hypothetical protein
MQDFDRHIEQGEEALNAAARQDGHDRMASLAAAQVHATLAQALAQ